jgi:thiamine biosynthesis lipoprotein
VTAATLGEQATGCVRLAIEAMATRFELVFPPGGGSQAHAPDRLRAIGEESLAEVVRQEARLSAYRAASDIAWINAHAGDHAVKVEPGLFALLRRAVTLSHATEGAFDITVGPLMRVWQFAGGGVGASRPLPSAGLVADARARVGCQYLDLDPRGSTIRFARSGMSIDLGAAGKGHAIDTAARALREQGITSALLHGGTSSVHAIGAPPDAGAWTIGWAQGRGRRTFAVRDSALSVSAAHGKAFTSDGHVYGHVIDPRTGWPTDAASSAIVTGPGSLECDALSTALLVLGADWLPTLRARFAGYDGAVA